MIVLERFDVEKDLSRLLEWVDSQRLNIIWASDKFSYPLDEKQMTSYFKSLNYKKTLAFKVVNMEIGNSDVVGHAELDIDGKEVKISRLLISKTNRGKGFGKEMMIALINYIKRNLKYNEICLTVFTFNKPAISLYEKLGFETTEINSGFMSYEKEVWDRQKMVLNNE